MHTQKQLLIIGIIFIVVFSIPFFNITTEYKKKFNITVEEIEGISEITDIHKLDILLKNIRGLNQLNESQAESLKRTLSISEDTLLESIKKLKDKRIENLYFSLLRERGSLSKEQLFKRYTELLKLLEYKRIDKADTSNLLFESDRTLYFLMTTAVLNIPQAIENIGKIRGIGLGMLVGEEKKGFLLKSNLHEFLQNIQEIKFIIEKLPSNDSAEFTSLLDSIMTDFNVVSNIVDELISNSSELTPPEYFLQTSQLVNNINNLFIVSKNILTDRLKQREYDIENKILFIIILYIILVSITIFAIYLNYSNRNKEYKILKKRREQVEFTSRLQDDYIKEQSLKQMCDKSLNHLINQFKAINGSLYLFDEENKKLYLVSTYGIKYDSLEQTLSLHENIIAENIIEKKINILNIDQTINLGNIKISSTKLVTIPILEFDKSIGTLQLVFDNKFDNVDIDFLQQTISLMGSYISKALQDDESKRYLKLIDQNVLISQTDLDGNITQVSEELCNLSKYTKEELLGKKHRILRHKDMPEEIFIDLWSTITQGITWRGEIKNRTKDGGFYWIDSIISADKDINGNIIGFTAIRTNITDKKKIEEIAITDGLTSLFNRRHFDNIFSQQIEIAHRIKGLLAFVLIDIDHFKQYNDTYGHQEGDTTLKLVASELKKTLKRPDDYTFRLGGEEFGLLYHITNEDDGYTIANLARENIENLKIEHSGNSASKYVTISAGLYVIKHDDINNEDEIYKKSDEALYLAKQSGRNQVKKVEF